MHVFIQTIVATRSVLDFLRSQDQKNHEQRTGKTNIDKFCFHFYTLNVIFWPNILYQALFAPDFKEFFDMNFCLTFQLLSIHNFKQFFQYFFYKNYLIEDKAIMSISIS